MRQRITQIETESRPVVPQTRSAFHPLHKTALESFLIAEWLMIPPFCGQQTYTSGNRMNGTIGKWEIVQLYVSALKKSAWVEAISLGYTLLEMQLRFLVKSKARPSGQPLDDAVVENCKYLIQVADLARDEGFLPQVVFEKVESFNAARIRAIHKLLTGQSQYLNWRRRRPQ